MRRITSRTNPRRPDSDRTRSSLALLQDSETPLGVTQQACKAHAAGDLRPQRLRGSRATRNLRETQHVESTLVRAFGTANGTNALPMGRMRQRGRLGPPEITLEQPQNRPSSRFQEGFRDESNEGSPGCQRSPAGRRARNLGSPLGLCRLRVRPLAIRSLARNRGAHARLSVSLPASDLRRSCRNPDAPVGPSDGPAGFCGMAAPRKRASLIWKRPRLPARSHATPARRARP